MPSALSRACSFSRPASSSTTTGVWSPKTASTPVVVDTDALSETVRIQIPTEYKVDELPSPIHIESPYGKYDAAWTQEGQTIQFRRTLEVPAQTVPSAQYAALKKFLDTISGSPNSPVVLIR
ncbi:MAG: DUF3858 domain-containing protein [Paludibaculum sp.]